MSGLLSGGSGLAARAYVGRTPRAVEHPGAGLEFREVRGVDAPLDLAAQFGRGHLGRRGPGGRTLEAELARPSEREQDLALPRAWQADKLVAEPPAEQEQTPHFGTGESAPGRLLDRHWFR